MKPFFLLLATCALGACLPGRIRLLDASTDGPTVTDASDGAAGDAGPPRYDAGPPPNCSALVPVGQRLITRSATRLPDDPTGVVAYPGGELFVTWRSRPMDTSEAELVEGLRVSPQGMPNGGRINVATVPVGTRLGQPAAFGSTDGAWVLFEASSGSRDNSFSLELRSVLVDGLGRAGTPFSFHGLYQTPVTSPLDTNRVAGLSNKVAGFTDAGLTLSTLWLWVADTRTQQISTDLDVTASVPMEALDGQLVTTGNRQPLFVFRVGARVQLLSFENFQPDPHGPLEIQNSNVARIQGAVFVQDAVVLAWSVTNGNATYVYVSVVGRDGTLRLQSTAIESFADEGDAPVTVVPAWGGAAVVWRRNDRIRTTVISPDGRLFVDPFDLALAPGAQGRPLVLSDGRWLRTFVRLESTTQGGGLAYADGCIPAR